MVTLPCVLQLKMLKNILLAASEADFCVVHNVDMC